MGIETAGEIATDADAQGYLRGYEAAMRHALHWCREMRAGDGAPDWQACADALAEALTHAPPDDALREEVPTAVERIRRLEQAVRTMRNFISGMEKNIEYATKEADDALGETAETRRTR